MGAVRFDIACVKVNKAHQIFLKSPSKGSSKLRILHVIERENGQLAQFKVPSSLYYFKLQRGRCRLKAVISDLFTNLA